MSTRSLLIIYYPIYVLVYLFSANYILLCYAIDSLDELKLRKKIFIFFKYTIELSSNKFFHKKDLPN